MTAAAIAPRPARDSVHPDFWVGDPLILVYAVRHALTLRGGHVPRFVQQSIAANVGQLSRAGRRVIARDVKAWLDDAGTAVPAADRAAWATTLAVLDPGEEIR